MPAVAGASRSSEYRLCRQLTCHQFSVGQPLLPIRQFLIHALDSCVVRCDPTYDIGKLLGERRRVAAMLRKGR
jgi:hypothetical protein